MTDVIRDEAAGVGAGPPARPWARRARPWLFGLLILAAYLANRRGVVATDDTFPNQLLPYAILQGDGPFLDRFRWCWSGPGGPNKEDVRVTNGRLASRHPVAPAYVYAAIYLPQMLAIDRAHPGWRDEPMLVVAYCGRMAKIAAAVVAALTGVILLRLLDSLGLGRVALPAALAATLGTDLWAVGSQACWAHGPAALMLAALLGLVAPPGISRGRLAAAGATAALLTAMRLVDVVFAAAAAAWVIRSRPRDFGWFILPAIPIALALFGYNLAYFGRMVGGQAELEALHPGLHGVEGVWTGDVLAGAAGTLFSPARGLFVFSPWALLAVLALPVTARRIAASPAIAWALGGLVPFALMLSKYSVWWAGVTFGPRYWIEAAPLLGVLLAFALDWCRLHARRLLVPFGLAIAWSIAIQAVGAFCYPSSWNLAPASVDTHHERLWDWSDNEILRCLREGRKPW